MALHAANSLVSQQLEKLPSSPGVYLMKDAGGDIIYVGKAANLHNRVRSYFGAGQQLTPKLRKLAARVAELEFFVTSSEQEALVLELNLIKRHHPRFNVRLKDDKTFPYLKISTDEDWPRIYVTRRLQEGGGRYFGPFTSARSVRQTLKVLKGIFPFRNCTRRIDGADSRACLEYHLGRCVAPCIGAVNRQQYAEVIRQVVLFLEGKQERLARRLEGEMNRAAEALDYEKAALFRDRIRAMQEVVEGQRLAARVRGEQDVIAFAQDGDQACVQVFLVRGGKLIGRESFVLQGTRGEAPQQVMTSFVQQFYASSPYVPPLLLLQHPVEDATVMREWLQGRRGGAVDIQVPRRGGKKQLVDTVAENARQGLEQMKVKQMAAPRALETALIEVSQSLGLKQPPERMEAYDISNIQGRAAVGSMVVFEQGKPKPAHYRRFRIKTVSGADDYAMLREVLQRRFKRLKGDASGSWAVLPDLVLIDGGRGQLSAAREAMGEAADVVPVVSLAKENEELFLPGRREPVVLPHSSGGLQLLQRLRDEAHRFALSYYTRVRRRDAFSSSLDAVPGIGPGRRRALLRRFGSVKAVREASLEELAAVKGMTAGQARRLKEFL